MAERSHWWTDRWLRSPLSLSFFLSFFLSFSDYLSICLSVYLSVCLSVYLSICRSVCLFICLSVYLSICLSVDLSICLSVYLSICLSIDLSISLICLSNYERIYLYLSTYLPIYLSTYLPIYLCIYLSYLSIYLSLCLSIYLSICKRKIEAILRDVSGFELDNIKNEAILRDFLNVWTWQRQKRSNSARLLHFSKLTTSKTKQFCEFDNVKNEAIGTSSFRSWQHQKRNNSARRPSKMESWVQSWRPRTNAFCDFSSPPVWSTAPATKKWCQVIRSAAPVTQNHLSKPANLRLQNATPLRKSAPGPPNISDEYRVMRLPATCIFPDPVQMPHACHRFWTCYKTLTFCSLLTRCTIPCACHAKQHLNV